MQRAIFGVCAHRSVIGKVGADNSANRALAKSSQGLARRLKVCNKPRVPRRHELAHFHEVGHESSSPRFVGSPCPAVRVTKVITTAAQGGANCS